MKKIFTIAALFLSVSATAQTKQQRNVGSFSGISGATGIDVQITQGHEETVFVSASDDSFVDKLKTVVEDGVLKIYYENTNWKNRKQNKLTLKAFVTYKTINKLMVGSGAGITALNAVTVPSLSLQINSGAKFLGEIKVTNFSLEQNSGAVSKITGNATNTKANLSSGAVCTSPNLITEMFKVDASSGSVIKIGVNKQLSAKVSSGAMVGYTGDAEIVNKNVSSGGTIKKL